MDRILTEYAKAAGEVKGDPFRLNEVLKHRWLLKGDIGASGSSDFAGPSGLLVDVKCTEFVKAGQSVFDCPDLYLI